MKRRGRPVLGVFAGFFFGLFLALDLVIFGVVALDSPVLLAMPFLGLAFGTFLGLKAPLSQRGEKARLSAQPDPSAA